jgi:hypothetical protein
LWRRRLAGDFSDLDTAQERRRDAGATKPSFFRELDELHFTARIRREKYGLDSEYQARNPDSPQGRRS